MKLRLLIAFILFHFSSDTVPQNFDLGSWNILNLKYKSNDKWSAFGEFQVRSLKFYNDFHYYECKGGVNYKAFKIVTLTLASGTYQTYKEGGDFILPKNNNEFRIWPQINLSQTVGKLNIEQRYRIELRFTSNGYRNRFRYRLGASYPFGKHRDGYQRFQFGASSEIFFTDHEPYFERNRFLLSLNYNYSKSMAFQMGYVNQFDYKINDETGRDFLLIGIYFEILRNKINKSGI